VTEESAMNRIERAMSRLAQRQHGIVSFAQLVAAGIKPDAITLRVRAGRLHRLYRGVYAVGHAKVSRHGRWLAAVLACGPGAVLSHRAAAALWDLRRWSGYPEVTVPTTAGRRRQHGIILHRSSTLTPRETTTREGIPVTAPSRTLADLRRVVWSDQHRAALRRAEILRLDVGAQARTEPDPERSELERAFLRLCRHHSLPRPRTQVIIGPCTVDFLWDPASLVVETDGWETHGTKSAFEDDRERDAYLKRQGFEVLRFSYRQVTREPEVVAATLRSALQAR
jgi:very-short-patch-repair endonuclease